MWKNQQPNDRSQLDAWLERLRKSIDVYADASYHNVLDQIEHNRLRSKIPHRDHTIERLKLLPKEPPKVISRGIRLSLPIKSANDPRLPLVA
jgi:hypothetical protein